MKRKEVFKHTYVDSDGEGWDISDNTPEQIRFVGFDIPLRRIGGNISDEVYINPIEGKPNCYWDYLDTDGDGDWEFGKWGSDDEFISLVGPATKEESDYYWEMVMRYNNCEKASELLNRSE